MNFTDVGGKGAVEGFCIIKTVAVKTTSRGDTYLDLFIADKTGEINAKLWSYNEAVHGKYEPNEIVKVRGMISPYNGVDQMRIEQIRKATVSDDINPEDYVESATYSGEQMYEALISVANQFEDEEIKALVLEIYRENRNKLVYWPAAFRLHHAIRGGLLLHTLSIVRLAQSVCGIYPFVNRDLLIAGAMLHDIAKLTEFEVGDTGIASGYTVKGNLIGHLAEGAMIIRETAKKLGTNEETSMLLQHMVLSHHGEPEFGAAIRPMFMEAELLSELDLMDARVYEMLDAVDGLEEGDFSSKLWALDNRKLYNHSKKGNDNDVKLF